MYKYTKKLRNCHHFPQYIYHLVPSHLALHLHATTKRRPRNKKMWAAKATHISISIWCGAPHHQERLLHLCALNI